MSWLFLGGHLGPLSQGIFVFTSIKAKIRAPFWIVKKNLIKSP